MRVIKHLFLLFFTTIFFYGCYSITSYSNSTQKLTFVKNKSPFISIEFSTPRQNYYSFSSCVDDSYTIQDINKEYGKIFLEYIDLNSACKWSGLPDSFFETSVNFDLKLKAFEVVEKIDSGAYSFKTYKINDESYLSAVYYSTTNTNIFLLDYDGKFYTKMLKKIDPSYENKYLNKKRFKGDYTSSLVRKNIIESYFRYEKLEL